MNLEIEIPGLKIKLEYAEKQHVDRLINSVMNYAQGGSFTDVYDVAQQFVKKKREGPKNFTPEVNGIKTYDNGKVTYKCKYNCGCGHDGVRYIIGDEEHVHCHDCNEKLKVSPATLNDAYDEDFNYYLAY